MNVMRLGLPAGLGQLLQAKAEPRRPGPGEVMVRVAAASLHFHDRAVDTGRTPVSERRISLSDTAGDVVEFSKGAAAIHAMKVDGHVASMGVLTGHEGALPTALLMAKKIRPQGVTVGSRGHQPNMVRALAAVGLRSAIDAHLPLTGLDVAFQQEEAGRRLAKMVAELADFDWHQT